MSEKVVEVIIGAQVRVSRHGLEGGGFSRLWGLRIRVWGGGISL